MPRPSPRTSLFQIFAKERIEFRARSRGREAIEFALFCNQSGRARKSTPGRPRERTANADSPHPERGDLLHCELACRPHKQIKRLRCGTGDHDRDLIACSNTRCVEAIGTGLGVGPEPPDRFLEIGSTNKKAFGASDKKRVAAGLIALLAARILSTAALSS